MEKESNERQRRPEVPTADELKKLLEKHVTFREVDRHLGIKPLELVHPDEHATGSTRKILFLKNQALRVDRLRELLEQDPERSFNDIFLVLRGKKGPLKKRDKLLTDEQRDKLKEIADRSGIPEENVLANPQLLKYPNLVKRDSSTSRKNNPK